MSRLRWIAVVLAACGCSAKDAVPANDEEREVFALFSEFRSGLKAKDPEKLWECLDKPSRAQAEQAARSLAAGYYHADPSARAERESSHGLSGDEILKLTGKQFLKSKRFEEKYAAVAASRIDRAHFQRDRGFIAFHLLDKGRDKLGLRQEDGAWKLTVPMPPGP